MDREIERCAENTFALMLQAQELLSGGKVNKDQVQNLLLKAIHEAATIKLPEEFPELLSVQKEIKNLQGKDLSKVTQEDLPNAKNLLVENPDCWKPLSLPPQADEEVEDLLML